MDELVVKARKKRPGLLVVDRAVHGKNQNYLTPENRVPEKELSYPWESCIISGGGWSHTKNAKYMSGREGVQLLVDIVTKGGNLLLNIAPTPEGTWQQGAYNLLREYENWMQINAEAIYETRAMAPYKVDNICMSRKKDGTMYFYYLAAEDENTLPQIVRINGVKLDGNSEVSLLGNKKVLRWEETTSGFAIEIPKDLKTKSKYVWVFKVTQ